MPRGTLFIFAVCLLLICSMSYAQTYNKSFPYELKKSDYIILPASLALFLTGSLLYANKDLNLSLLQIEELNRNQVNRFDRPATYNWNPSLNTTSDILALALPVLPVLIFIPHMARKEYDHAITYATMGCEVLFLTGGITVFTKTYTGRVRPYLYNTDLSASERYSMQGNEGSLAKTSFYSGHTATAFASAVFFSETYSRIYGKSWTSSLIWGTTLLAASITGYTREASGEHFTTDVLMGAAIGSAIGYVVPKLHQIKAKNISIMILPKHLHLCYRF